VIGDAGSFHGATGFSDAGGRLGCAAEEGGVGEEFEDDEGDVIADGGGAAELVEGGEYFGFDILGRAVSMGGEEGFEAFLAELVATLEQR